MSGERSAGSDRQAIVQLTHDYCWALDTRTWDALRDVFLPDVEADLGEGGQHGVDEVIARVSTALGFLDASQHTVSTHQIAIDGDRASGRCYVLAQHVRRGTPGGDNFLIGAQYDDEYRWVDAGWRISRRRISMTWFEGNRDVVIRPTMHD